MPELLQWPLDVMRLMRNGNRLARELREQPALREVRIAVLGGSTTAELVRLLELLLLGRGFRPVFWQSEFGRYWEDAVLNPSQIAEFKPDFVYVHTTVQNLDKLLDPATTLQDASQAAASIGERFVQIWDGIQSHCVCTVIQNNFELPSIRHFANYDIGLPAGVVSQVQQTNATLLELSRSRPSVVLHDINYLSAQIGLECWHDPSRWFSYKIPMTPQASGVLAFSLASLIASRFGQSKKVLVLDLDNTLWGGVIGDDGVDRIVIGRETPQGEAYTAFQEYCLALKARGVVLAICSKNNDAVAREGFEHPDSLLKTSDFAAFKANWAPKHENLIEIAHELNLGLDSFVFVDDNPAERTLVRGQLPSVAVPEVGQDVSLYPHIVDRQRYFETLSLSREDLQRSEQYAGNAKRNELQARFESYDDYLMSLEMVAEVGPFHGPYIERIAQLTNKTNQFNLTTKRYSLPEITVIASSRDYVTLFIRLKDRFGDNGLISVIIGRKQGNRLDIDLWLMSCRVLKRDVELLALDQLVRAARADGITELQGSYVRTPKNDMVSRHYERLGFTLVNEGAEHSLWMLNISDYTEKNRNIQVNEQ